MKTTKDNLPKQPVKPKELTFAQKKALLFTPCKTKKELKNFIKYFLDLDLPDVKVSRYADFTPMDMIWEMYSIAVLDKNPENIQELLYCAARGSGKTVGAAIADLLAILHAQRDVVHVGAILPQAMRCYEYIQSYLNRPRIKEILTPAGKDGKSMIEKNNTEQTVFDFDGKKVDLFVVPATMARLNGLHSSIVSCDELDTLSKDGIKAIQEVSGILTAKDGKSTLRINISTRKSRFGIMNQMMENAEKEGRTVRKWTFLEFTEACPEERRGKHKVYVWVKQSTCEAYSEEEFELKISIDKRKDFIREEVYEGCICSRQFGDKPCPAVAMCLGDAALQTSKSPMLNPIGEFIKKTRTETPDWCLSQLMNLKPSMEGIVYVEFKEETHVLTWNQMWFKLVGKEFPGTCTHDIFIRKCREMKLMCVAGMDFGWASPSAVVIFYVDNKENVYVVRSDAIIGINDASWIHYIKTKYHNQYNVQLYYPDIANGSAVDMMRLASLPVADSINKDINLGIQIIKKSLIAPGSREIKLVVAKETCLSLIDEFGKYHYKQDAAGQVVDIPEKEYDHSLDALRYPMIGLFSRPMAILEGGSDSYGSAYGIIDQRTGGYLRPPTAAEFAEVNGIPFNADEVNDKKVGMIGTIAQLRDDEDDENGGVEGGGGFLMSF